MEKHHFLHEIFRRDQLQNPMPPEKMKKVRYRLFRQREGKVWKKRS